MIVAHRARRASDVQLRVADAITMGMPTIGSTNQNGTFSPLMTAGRVAPTESASQGTVSPAGVIR